MHSPVPAPTSGRRLRARWVLAAALLPVLAQLVALFNPDMVIIDCEERYNAAHAWLWPSHPLQTLRMQYRVFCGGCTLVSLLGALPLRLVGASFGAWKLVALGFTGLAGVAGAWQLERRIGRTAAVAFLLLLFFAPLAYIRMSLLSWGNHVEIGVLGLCVLGLSQSARPGLRRIGGVVAGVALWAGFSMVPLFAGLVLALVIRRDRAGLQDLAWGAVVAAGLWALQWGMTETTPFGAIYVEGESMPTLERVPKKLWMLLAPVQVAGLFGVPRLSLGIPLGYAWSLALAVATVVALRRGGLLRAAGLMLCAWVLAFLLVRFGFEWTGPGDVPTPTGLRYAGTVLPLSMLIVGGVAGMWWQGGRRLWAILLLTGPMASGVAARAATLTAPFPDAFVWDLEAVDWPKARWIAAFLLPPEEHAACDAIDPGEVAAHAYARGRRAAWESFSETRKPLPPDGPKAMAEGMGAEIMDRYDPEPTGNIGMQAAALGVLVDWPVEDREGALSEILEERIWVRGHWFGGMVPEPVPDLAAERIRIQTLPRFARDEAWRISGRRWARQRARTALPVAVELPDEAPLPFVTGVGEGLGLEWGPRAAVPAPAGLPEQGEAVLIAGYQRGMAAGWRGGSIPELGAAPERNLEEDRWWGPVPAQLCRCRVACE